MVVIRRLVWNFKGEYREHHALNIGDILFANTDLTRNGDVVGSPPFSTDLVLMEQRRIRWIYRNSRSI